MTEITTYEEIALNYLREIILRKILGRAFSRKKFSLLWFAFWLHKIHCFHVHYWMQPDYSDANVVKIQCAMDRFQLAAPEYKIL